MIIQMINILEADILQTSIIIAKNKVKVTVLVTRDRFLALS